MTVTSRSTDLDWLLDDVIERVVDVDRAVVLSADGLLMARSQSLTRADAEHLSAVASAYQSLSRGTGRHFGFGEVRQTMVEMEHGYLLVMAAGRGACLALFTESEADLGLVAYEMNLLVKRVGAALAAMPRNPKGERVDAKAS
ncbi:roadblock/LC7 domain-containing protein [Haloechinothrix halophila]|uniref:roadblock/LC7 domain-containing protein n=1 Tax=Haloechinothrix halophila TaxID=1069073 RepID=UPI0004095D4A|nr:roadblock/LC7 domain-containing protein [Haloechinothrix halophila]